MIKIIVSGAAGRMGSRILELASKNPKFKIIGALESQNHPSIGKKILDGTITIQAHLELFKEEFDVLIDFTSPEATLSHLRIIKNWNRVRAVIGTTGFSKEETAFIQKISKKMPILISSNMSVGINLMFEIAKIIGRKLPNYDIEIIESHHNQKKDAPSGTALTLAKELVEELKRDFEDDLIYGRKGNVGKRKDKEIGIHSVRAGDIVGDHTVLFATQGERLELTHRASSRDAFATGALHAAEWISHQKPSLYSMKEVLR
ncbi:MAG: 4-hydroxy-tetrahydrodipicolinate reductase [Elusimicrobia bacterium RIFCSPLOWO2_02_FULL_39_32]|nr:MAG: 4-hydroxy-tetrahydrodipicolinate reductase [Elusimicrobia bacterium GWA2_38_7]OGR79010.1 MAG: 4-hydroxy-tetrahydrodipicolinate reductase [Elusimicrobia bacterium RIFCSPHIGHO2_02_FULL_39_36]OGR92594.1 MAG: 4-hydroxy-tetrahydrodipicolinate reductase [Elusimicrobia bacterium RIFCSPLOWO2_02_FULL_39_32]OGR99241.1 MAG: 4-hydroxy-tetrahydrodipicolinate reductase [Elusimicrobia bacterium RIFCSPLOWO2_12_FULL_39_28]